MSAFVAVSALRLLTLPITALFSLATTSIVVANTGSELYGIVNTIATLGALVPFADLGIGGAVTTAAAVATKDPEGYGVLDRTITSGYRVLSLVAATLVLISVSIASTGAWSNILGRSLTISEQWVATAALSTFALSVPVSMGSRILIGLGHAKMVALTTVLTSLALLMFTLAITVVNADPIAYAWCPFAAQVTTGAVNSLVARRKVHHLRGRLSSLIVETPKRQRFLAGSGGMFIITIGLPVGLETGRIVLAHTVNSSQLSSFALAAQIYAIGWSVLSVSGGPLWRDFARLRQDLPGSIRLWRQAMVMLAAVSSAGAIFMIFFGPPFARILSHGEIRTPHLLFACFGLLLIAQSLHMPGGVMLTTPTELWWQARWVTLLSIFSISSQVGLSRLLGIYAIPLSMAVAVFAFQYIPDLACARRMLERRVPPASPTTAIAGKKWSEG